MSLFGNTFDKTTKAYGHARKVWREVVDQYPGGGTVENVDDFVSAGVIPAGSPVKFDMEDKTATIITQEELEACWVEPEESAESDDPVFSPDAAKALGINGFTYNDVVVTSDGTVGTVAVVYRGELYKYMITEEQATVMEAIKPAHDVTLVY